MTTEFNIDIAKEVWMQEAREDGIEIGEARGEARSKLEIARAMIDYGDTIEKASLITGIPADELRRRVAESAQ
jgi:predicted transposase YdaD